MSALFFTIFVLQISSALCTCRIGIGPQLVLKFYNRSTSCDPIFYIPDAQRPCNIPPCHIDCRNALASSMERCISDHTQRVQTCLSDCQPTDECYHTCTASAKLQRTLCNAACDHRLDFRFLRSSVPRIHDALRAYVPALSVQATLVFAVLMEIVTREVMIFVPLQGRLTVQRRIERVRRDAGMNTLFGQSMIVKSDGHVRDRDLSGTVQR